MHVYSYEQSPRSALPRTAVATSNGPVSAINHHDAIMCMSRDWDSGKNGRKRNDLHMQRGHGHLGKQLFETG